jgi:hypothetical protein
MVWLDGAEFIAHIMFTSIYNRMGMRYFTIKYHNGDNVIITTTVTGWTYAQVKRDFCKKQRIKPNNILKITI